MYVVTKNGQYLSAIITGFDKAKPVFTSNLDAAVFFSSEDDAAFQAARFKGQIGEV